MSRMDTRTGPEDVDDSSAVAADSRTSRQRDGAPRRRWAPVVGPQQILAVVGGVAVIVSGFLAWTSSGAGFLTGADGREIPLEFLWDSTAESSDPSLLIALIPIGVVAVVSALWLASIGLRVLSGLAALLVVAAFAYQLANVLDDLGGDAGGVFDHLGVGWYIALVGGLLTLIAASGPMWTRNRA